MKKLIDNESENALKEKFSKELKEPVDVKLFINPILLPGNEEQQELNNFAKQFITELSLIDQRIILQEFSISDELATQLGIKTSPSILIGYDLGYKILFNGAPYGYEANSLIETISLVSSGNSNLSNSTKNYLKYTNGFSSLKVFVTPTCPYCPSVVILANQIAIELKGKVFSECVEANENQELSLKFGISSVPHTFINNDINAGLVGFSSEKNFVDFIMTHTGNEEYKKLKKEEEKMKEEKEKLPDSPDDVVYISDNNFKNALEKYENLVIDCWAEWCMPCKMLSPIIDQLAKENKGKIVFGKLNVDENPETASNFGIMSIPTLLIFKKGTKVDSIVGVRPKNELQKTFNEIFK